MVTEIVLVMIATNLGGRVYLNTLKRYEIDYFNAQVILENKKRIPLESIINLEEVMAMYSTWISNTGTNSTAVSSNYDLNVDRWTNSNKLVFPNTIDTKIKNPAPKRKLSFKEEMEKELEDWWVEF